MGCRGTACLTMVFTTGCRGISAPAPGAPPPPPSSLILVSAGLFLLHVLTPLSGCHFCLSQLFFLLKNVITEVLPLSLIGSALAGGGSILEPAGIGALEHRGSFQQLLTEATPVTPPLPKPCHTKPIHMVKVIGATGKAEQRPFFKPLQFKIGKQWVTHEFLYLPGAPKPLIGRDLLEKLEAEIKFKEREVEVLIPESKYIQASVFLLQEDRQGSEVIPKDVEEAAIPFVWAGEIPGRSKRAEPVRIDLKPESTPLTHFSLEIGSTSNLGHRSHYRRSGKDHIKFY
ncbi:uncharacterized protein ACIBXB_005903 [Morphnus guianensis]